MRRSVSPGKLAIVVLTSFYGLLPASGQAAEADPSTTVAERSQQESEDLDDLIGGFEDEDEDLGDDLLGGFEDDLGDRAVDADETETASWMAALPFGDVLEERVDVSGSLSMGAEYSYLDHSVPHGDDPTDSTHWGGLTRLDLDGFLQLDVDLPHDWRARGEVLGWYDFAYHINGRGGYGNAVLDVYEWQVDTGEAYVSGPVHQNVSLTVGRKVVNWGRSDTFRVVDVVNPLDNKEPGLVDIEDLRRPLTMLKLDATKGPWSGQFLLIPEFRYDRNPPRGSDFFPDVPPPQAALFTSPISGRSDFAEVPAIAAKADARFSGWDLSLYGGYVDESGRVLDRRGPPSPTGYRREANRIGMLGAAGNVTRGAWLAKIEMAWLSDLRVLRVRPADPVPLPFTVDNDRIDTMIGIEYYGRDDLTIAVEVVNRHLIQERGSDERQVVNRSRFESSIRITRPFFRERMNVTALAIGFGERLQNGGLFRFSTDWELTDAWKMEGGILIFIGGPDEGIGAFDSNDRLYAELKYSF